MSVLRYGEKLGQFYLEARDFLYRLRDEGKLGLQYVPATETTNENSPPNIRRKYGFANLDKEDIEQIHVLLDDGLFLLGRVKKDNKILQNFSDVSKVTDAVDMLAMVFDEVFYPGQSSGPYTLRLGNERLFGLYQELSTGYYKDSGDEAADGAANLVEKGAPEYELLDEFPPEIKGYMHELMSCTTTKKRAQRIVDKLFLIGWGREPDNQQTVIDAFQAGQVRRERIYEGKLVGWMEGVTSSPTMKDIEIFPEMMIEGLDNHPDVILRYRGAIQTLQTVLEDVYNLNPPERDSESEALNTRVRVSISRFKKLLALSEPNTSEVEGNQAS
jgi:hypothetical protein